MSTLSKFLERAGMTQVEFAARVGVRQSTVSKLCNGVQLPSLSLAVKIESVTAGSVPANAWHECQSRTGQPRETAHDHAWVAVQGGPSASAEKARGI